MDEVHYDTPWEFKNRAIAAALSESTTATVNSPVANSPTSSRESDTAENESDKKARNRQNNRKKIVAKGSTQSATIYAQQFSNDNISSKNTKNENHAKDLRENCNEINLSYHYPSICCTSSIPTMAESPNLRYNHSHQRSSEYRKQQQNNNNSNDIVQFNTPHHNSSKNLPGLRSKKSDKFNKTNEIWHRNRMSYDGATLLMDTIHGSVIDESNRNSASFKKINTNLNSIKYNHEVLNNPEKTINEVVVTCNGESRLTITTASFSSSANPSFVTVSPSKSPRNSYPLISIGTFQCECGTKREPIGTLSCTNNSTFTGQSQKRFSKRISQHFDAQAPTSTINAEKEYCIKCETQQKCCSGQSPQPIQHGHCQASSADLCFSSANSCRNCRSSFSPSASMENENAEEWHDVVHDAMERADAERILKPLDVGDFLLRRRNEGNLALSLRSTDGILHIKLEKRNGFWVLGEGPHFATIGAMLRSYRRTELPVRGAKHVRLRTAITAADIIRHQF